MADGTAQETRLANICSRLFLFLTTFRRNARQVETDAAWLRRSLIEIFQEQENAVKGDPDLQRVYEKARYPLVALADEIALNTDWGGRDVWEEELLEQHFFGTSIAGEEFYVRLKEVGPEEDQLAEIYFLCLSLGFKGRYRSRPEERRELQQNLYARLPGRITKKSDAICPGVYDYNVERDMTKLPVISAARIAVVLVGGIFLAMVAARVVTENNLADLGHKAQAIATAHEKPR